MKTKNKIKAGMLILVIIIQLMLVGTMLKAQTLKQPASMYAQADVNSNQVKYLNLSNRSFKFINKQIKKSIKIEGDFYQVTVSGVTGYVHSSAFRLAKGQKSVDPAVYRRKMASHYREKNLELGVYNAVHQINRSYRSSAFPYKN